MDSDGFRVVRTKKSKKQSFTTKGQLNGLQRNQTDVELTPSEKKATIRKIEEARYWAIMRDLGTYNGMGGGPPSSMETVFTVETAPLQNLN